MYELYIVILYTRRFINVYSRRRKKYFKIRSERFAAKAEDYPYGMWNIRSLYVPLLSRGGNFRFAFTGIVYRGGYKYP